MCLLLYLTQKTWCFYGMLAISKYTVHGAVHEVADVLCGLKDSVIKCPTGTAEMQRLTSQTFATVSNVANIVGDLHKIYCCCQLFSCILFFSVTSTCYCVEVTTQNVANFSPQHFMYFLLC